MVRKKDDKNIFMAQYNILVVDDEINNLNLLKRTLRKKYNVFTAISGPEALEILKDNKVDLIISDQRMPEMEGTTFFEHTLKISPDSVRILITGYSDVTTLISAINNVKINKYIKKPWSPNNLINIVDAALELYQLNKNNHELISDLKELFSGTIKAIMEALDAKDSFTFGRSKRVAYHSLKVGEIMKLSESELSELELAGLLHDIGLIGVPDNILSKPENLTLQEFEIVKKHVILGAEILHDIKQLKHITPIIRHHHERFDGTGYPDRLKGHDIPIQARIIAVADAYDSMVSHRAYRKSLVHSEAVARIKQGSGSQFDPDAVEAFISVVGD